MLFGLLLALIVAALAVVVHFARMRSLERELMSRVAGQIQGFSSSHEEARRTADEVSSLERSKSRVLVNLMNDLRTPLMMIKSPLQTTMQIAGAPDLDDNDVERMMQQANRLQRGLDQIQRVLELDLGGTALNYQLNDFIDFSERFVTSLRPLAERHGVTIHFSSDPDALPFAFDAEKIEQVLQSFVERAFTGMSGGDTLQFLLTTRRLSQDGVDRVALEISDNGRPIDEKYLKILRTQGDWGAFENSIVDMTALGLALAHRFVALHGGEVELDRLESGTRVRVFLPIRSASASEKSTISGDTMPIPDDLSALLNAEQFSKPEKPLASENTEDEKNTTILVVDDHPGTRGYLAYALRRHHNVIEATNGEEALAIVRETNPDLVISDIMMPVMDGNALCRAIKADDKLNHIPIFLVTANAVSTMKKEGLESGADDYLTKPFDLEEAVMRINNEIKSRTQLRRRFSREVVIKPSDITVTSADEAFLNRAREIVEENIEDGNFGVQELASELGLSPRQLQRRLRDTVDQSPVEFIRTLRLQRAAQLLEGQYGNVSEVAYSVGFTSLSYFAKCFREQYGMAPSEFKAEQAA